MIKLNNPTFTDPLTYQIQVNVPTTEYQAYRERVISQLIKTVKVDGFRPGNVPTNIALEKLNRVTTEQTILEETINKYQPESLEEVKKLLTEQNRIVINYDIDLLEGDGPQEDKSFSYSIIARLLPIINLEKALELKEPSLEKEDYTNIKDKEVVFKEEVKALLERLNQSQKSQNKKDYSSLEEAFEENEELKTNYKTMEGFKEKITKFYEDEKKAFESRKKQEKLIFAMVKTVPDFDLPTNQINSEVTRITQGVIDKSVEKNISIDESFKGTGLERINEEKILNEEEVKTNALSAMNKEFKLMYILRCIYESKLETEEKIKSEEVVQYIKTLKQMPEYFGLPKNLTDEEYEGQAWDRLMRSKAFNKYLELLEIKSL